MVTERVQRWSLCMVLALVMGWTACGDGDSDRVVNDSPTPSGCVACHLDQGALTLLAVEKELPEDTGEG